MQESAVLLLCRIAPAACAMSPRHPLPSALGLHKVDNLMLGLTHGNKACHRVGLEELANHFVEIKIGR